MKDPKDLLKKTKIFKGLGENFNKIADFFEYRHYLKDTVIFKQGSACPGFFVVCNGSIRIDVQIIGEQTATIGHIDSSSHVGEIALLEGGTASATAIAADDCILCYLSAATIDKVKTSYPELLFQLTMNVALATSIRIRYINDLVIKKFLFYEIQHSTVKKSDAVKNQKPQLQKIDSDIKKIMHRLKFFRHITDDEFECLCNNTLCYSAPKSLTLFHEGDLSQSFYMPLLGAIQSVLYYGGKFSKLELYGPGDIFGQLSYIDAKPRMGSTLLREEALFLEFKSKDMSNIKTECESLWYKLHYLLFKEMAKMLRNTEKMFTRASVDEKHHV